MNVYVRIWCLVQVSGLTRHRIWPWDEGMRENKTTKKEKKNITMLPRVASHLQKYKGRNTELYIRWTMG